MKHPHPRNTTIQARIYMSLDEAVTTGLSPVSSIPQTIWQSHNYSALITEDENGQPYLTLDFVPSERQSDSSYRNWDFVRAIAILIPKAPFPPENGPIQHTIYWMFDKEDFEQGLWEIQETVNTLLSEGRNDQ